jgi:uncharacterized membrane protein
MDPDALRDEVEAWVRDGIITEAQAEAILERYEEDGGRSRAVLALSAVGAALVLVGVTLFLATNWEGLPTGAQVVVLLAAPGLAYAGGGVAYRRALSRIGLACSLLGSVLVGPSLFLLADLASAEIATVWLLSVWATVALSTGHALGSRAGVGIGLAVLVALVADLAAPADPVPAVAFLGIALFALADRHDDGIEWTYRTGGAILALSGLLFLTTLEGRYAGFDVGPSAILVATVLAGFVGVGWLSLRDDRCDAAWAATTAVALGAATGLAVLAPDRLPGLVAFLGGHVATLGGVGATGYLGYRRGSRRLVDLAALSALGQTLSFVASTVVDALSGSIALVVAGLILLGAGVALERGRRRLLSRLDR